MIKNYPLGHLKISSGNLKEIFLFIKNNINHNKHSYCMPLNLTKYVVSQKDSKLKETINAADSVISDGVSIVLLSKRFSYKNVYRVTGIDLAEMIISKSKENGWKMFFLGSSQENIERAIERLYKKFGNLNIVGCQHGYFKNEDINSIIENINLTQAQILFLGLGMPQKEYFINDYFNKLHVNFCLPVGGAFDVWADSKQRTPKILQNIGLEWFYRSFYDKNKALNITQYGLTFFKDFFFCKR